MWSTQPRPCRGEGRSPAWFVGEGLQVDLSSVIVGVEVSVICNILVSTLPHGLFVRVFFDVCVVRSLNVTWMQGLCVG